MTTKPLTHKEIEALPLRANTFRPTVAQWNEIFYALFSRLGLMVVVTKDEDFGEETEIDGDAIKIDVFRDLPVSTLLYTFHCNRETFPDTPNKSIVNPHQIPKYRIDGYRLYYWMGTGGDYNNPPDTDDVTVTYAQGPAAIAIEALRCYVDQMTTEWQYSSKVLMEQDAKLEKEAEDYSNRG